MKFADLVKYAHVFALDLKNIHWHAVGERFDTIHNIAEELYKEALAEVDDFAEMAISSGEVVESLNSLDELDDWTPALDTSYDWDKFVSYLSTNGLKYLELLQSVETENDGYKSLLDNYIAFWSKEINYKNSNRAISLPENDSNEETSVEVVSNDESEYNDDAFIGFDNSNYSEIYNNDVEFDDSDSDFSDMSKAFDIDDTNDASSWEDMIEENGDLFKGELLDISNMENEETEEDNSELSPMSNDMIVTGGEPVKHDKFDFDNL